MTFLWGGDAACAHIEDALERGPMCHKEFASKRGVLPVRGPFPPVDRPMCARCFAKWCAQLEDAGHARDYFGSGS